jgi:mono/diheme cytochrome c family protein
LIYLKAQLARAVSVPAHWGETTMKPIAAAMLSLAVLAAFGPARAASVAHGRALAATNCGACHSIDRSGASPNAKAPPFRTLGQSYPIEDLEESLAEGIVTGHRQMPQFQFSPSDVDDLVAFLKSLQPGAPSPRP